MPPWFINEEQRGVSQLQIAVSAATTGNAGRPTSMMQISPGLVQPASPAQLGGMTGLPRLQGDVKRWSDFSHRPLLMRKDNLKPNVSPLNHAALTEPRSSDGSSYHTS